MCPIWVKPYADNIGMEQCVMACNIGLHFTHNFNKNQTAIMLRFLPHYLFYIFFSIVSCKYLMFRFVGSNRVTIFTALVSLFSLFTNPVFL